jgi:hypothetical protein
MTVDEGRHDIDSLAAHLEDRLDGRERERLMEHLAGCVECRETLAMLAREADLLPPSVRGGSVSPASAWRRSGRLWLPLAATLVVAAATVTRLGWWTPADEGRPAVPSPGAGLPGEATGRRPAGPSPTAVTPGRDPAGSPTAEAGGQTGPRPSEKRDPVLRGVQRRIAGKSFRLVFGEWIDLEFDPAAALPIVDVKTPDDRADVLARAPDLAPYLDLGERVLVVHQGTVYRFGARPPD